jgi:3-oxoacyl-(acyl-carrier-protein) synthase
MSFAAEAARQAVDDAATGGSMPEPEGGLSLGIGLELFSMDDAIAKQAGAELPIERRERLTFLQTPSDLCVSVLAARFALTAPPATHVSACAAGTDAIGSAARKLELALDPMGSSPFSAAMRSAQGVADELWKEVEATYRGPLT